MRANDNVGTILAHPDKGRLWGGTEWPCSGGSLRHPASNVLFLVHAFALDPWFLSLCEAGCWPILRNHATAPKWCYEIHLMLLHIYPSQVGFAVSPKRGTTQIFTRLQFGRMMRNQWIWGLPWFAGIPPFSHVPTGLFAVWRPAAWQASFAEIAETATGDPGPATPLGAIAPDFLGRNANSGRFWMVLGFSFWVLWLRYIHKSTWHAFCVAWQMLQQQGWQINIQNNLLVFMCCRQIWMYFGATFCIGPEYIGHPLTDTTGWQQIHGHGLNGKTVCAPQVLGMRSQMTLDSMHLQYFSTRKYGLPEIMSLCLSRLWMFESVKHVAQTAWHFFGATQHDTAMSRFAWFPAG